MGRTRDPEDDACHDEATVVGMAAPALPLDDQGWEQAIAAMRDALVASGAVPIVTGYRLYWSTGHGAGWRDLDAGEGDFVVIGRHSQCDVRIDADLRVSLRHLLATPWTLDDGAVLLRLLDLRTYLPFTVPGDVKFRRSIVSSGPVIASLGPCIVGGVPIEANVPLPPADDPSWSMDRPVLREEAVAPAGRPPERHVSVITSLPEVTHISEVGKVLGGRGAARVTLRTASAQASVELGDAELRRGVLIGRYERCLDHGLLAVLGPLISRVHILLLLERDAVHAYDLCSTNGTSIKGRRVRRAALGPGETRLRLGGSDGVDMVWSG